jgi:hypothetical protein
MAISSGGFSVFQALFMVRAQQNCKRKDGSCMEWNEEMQMRHAAGCIWPGLLHGRTMEILRVEERLQQLGYDGGIDTLCAEDIVEGWKAAGWILISPNGVEMRLTPKGSEQLAMWSEEDHLWQIGSMEEMEMPKRLRAGEPANNLRRICAVIGNRMIEGIHDPYIDAKSLDNLLKLSELGVQISLRLRLLATPPNRVTTQFLRDDINTQNNSKWEMRTYTMKEKPHRRFLVCSDGSIVTCGLSLNNLNKDEALDLIPPADDRSKHDIQFFEDKWKQGVVPN